MPINDYVCPGCGVIEMNVYQKLIRLPEPQVLNGYLTTTHLAPRVCPTCSKPGILQFMQVIPPRVAIDLAFAPFDTEVRQPDGTYRTVRVSTLNDIRRIERESEARARNGEGEALRWRDYSQDRSNADVHTFGAAPDAAPSEAAKRRFAKTVSAVEPEAALGPGVTEDSASLFGDR